MKLFIWNEPYDVRYGSSLLVVAAESLEAAKEQATQGKMYSYGQYEEKGPVPTAWLRLGEPTRVLDLPCAEWHQWSE